MKQQKRLVISTGDSITKGLFSSDYLSIIKRNISGHHYNFVNAGHNGDKAADLLKRIDKDVINRKPDFITILIGANDARQKNDRDSGLKAYRDTIERIVSRVRSRTNAPLALISLTPLGENLNSAQNNIVRDHNLILQDISSKYNLSYLPLFESLAESLEKQNARDHSEFKLNLGTALIKSGFKKFILGMSWNAISASNGYSFLTDGIHINDKAGTILANLIQNWLRNF